MQEYSNLNVLVTGGAGFVGSNLVHRLAQLNANITIVDNFYTGNLDNIRSILKATPAQKIETVRADIENFELVKRLVSDAKIVFHLAARNIIASTSKPREDFNTNVGGTLNILLAALESNVKRIVYTSSASVYGNPKYLPINEDDPINLLTPYAVGKYAGEGYCMAFYESHRLPVTVLRLSNVYGPYQRPENPYTGVVAKFMQSSINGEPMEIHGDGLSTRDFTYVGDVVDALLMAAINPRAEGEVFNVATGLEINIMTLTREIGKIYQNKKRKFIDRRDIDNIRRRVLNIEKIRRTLGWMPRTRLHDGLYATKQWLEEGK